MATVEPFELMEPDLTDAMRLSFVSIAHRCARGVRGCTTDEQYQELTSRIVEAMAFAGGHIKPMSLDSSYARSPQKEG